MMLITSNVTDIPSYIINVTQITKYRKTQIDNTIREFFWKNNLEDYRIKGTMYPVAWK